MQAGKVFSFAQDNPAVPGCTVSGEILPGVICFSLAAGTDISAERYPGDVLQLQLAGRSRSPRLRSRPWRDPRLAGGIALIGAAVALGAWAVDAAAETEEIYVLAQDVAPGADLGADGVLTVVSSHPGTGAYVRAGDLPAGSVATRSLKAGELLPATAVGPAQEQNLRSILIEVAEGLPAGVRAGEI